MANPSHVVSQHCTRFIQSILELWQGNYVHIIATSKGKCIFVVCECDFFKHQYYFIVLRKKKQARGMAKISTGNSRWKQ